MKTMTRLSVIIVTAFVPGDAFSIRQNLISITRHRTQRRYWGSILYAETQSSAKEELKADTNDEFSSMPWTDFQAWALRDNLPKYIVSIPSNNDDEKLQMFALWRTMTREVTELCGYPVEFLQEMYQRQQLEQSESNSNTIPGALPLLDEFDFEPNGGLKGSAYGIAGVADGSMIETPPVSNVHITVPKGYVTTEDGGVAYELGTPLKDSDALNELNTLGNLVAKGTKELSTTTTDMIKSSSAAAEDPDATLVRLGASTGILLGGALAFSMLSHHLTVNVFWV